MIRHVVKWNSSICDGVERILPGKFIRSLLYLHELTAARLMNARPSQVVADIGGGHLCPFGRHRRRELGTTIVGVDILESQLRGNPIIDYAVVADASRALPFRDASLDLIVTRSVVEHLHDNEMFFAETSRVLRPGGHAIHVFPGRFAPFALLNRVLPARVAKNMLHLIFPQWRESCGFKAYYTNCSYARILSLLTSNGFDVDEVHLRYYQSIYFKFFVPLYLLSVLYDLLLWLLDARLLSSQILVVARKTSRAWTPSRHKADGPGLRTQPG